MLAMLGHAYIWLIEEYLNQVKGERAVSLICLEMSGTENNASLPSSSLYSVCLPVYMRSLLSSTKGLNTILI